MGRAQPLRELMESLIAPPDRKFYTGTIKDPRAVFSDKGIEALDAKHRGSFVVFSYDSAVDADLAKYVTSNALADDSGPNILALYQLDRAPKPSHDLAAHGVESLIKQSPLIDFVTETFEGKLQPVPGMLVLGRLSSPTTAIYVSLNRTEKERPISDRVREVLRLIADATKPGTPDVLNSAGLGTALGLRNIPYSSSRPTTVLEKFAGLLGALWAHKSDLLAVAKLAASVKTGGGG